MCGEQSKDEVPLEGECSWGIKTFYISSLKIAYTIKKGIFVLTKDRYITFENINIMPIIMLMI